MTVNLEGVKKQALQLLLTEWPCTCFLPQSNEVLST